MSLILNLDSQFTEKYFKLPYSKGPLRDVEFLIRFVGKKDQDASRSKWFKNSKSGNILDGVDFQAMSLERSSIACMALAGWKGIKSSDETDVIFNDKNKERVVDALFTLPIAKTNESDVTDSNTLQSWVFGVCTDFNNFIPDSSNLLTS
jgi:hypothetical protein